MQKMWKIFLELNFLEYPSNMPIFSSLFPVYTSEIISILRASFIHDTSADDSQLVLQIILYTRH